MKFSDYREQKKHGTPDFPLEYYYVDNNHPQYVMPLHWHAEFEVLRVISGRLALYLNNSEYNLTAGETILIPSGTLHRGEPTDCIYECAVFDLRMASGYNATRISDMIRPLISADLIVTPDCPSAAEVGSRLLDSVSGSDPYYYLSASALIAEMIYALYSSDAVTHERGNDKRIAHRRAIMTLLLDKIGREYTTKITLADLAEMAGMNEKYLCRFFKSYTGQTPIDYINRLRIDRACFEMTVNKMNVTDAAYECGFNELSYFSKIFKKYKGVTPGKYKQRFATESSSQMQI